MSRPFFRPILAIPLSQWNDLVLVISTVTGINQQIRTTERQKSNGIILGACNDSMNEAYKTAIFFRVATTTRKSSAQM